MLIYIAHSVCLFVYLCFILRGTDAKVREKQLFDSLISPNSQIRWKLENEG